MALGAAVGAPAIPAVLLYILGHGLVKATLFVLSGRILAAEGTPLIAEVRGLLARRPGLAVPWLVAMVALVGLPPFSIFFSEVNILVAGWMEGMGVVVGIALFLLLIIFAGLVRLTVVMTLGEVPALPSSPPTPPDHSAHGPRLPLVLALITTAVIAFLAQPIGAMLARAAASLGELH
ncbi:MAG: hydrogenase, partial [Microbacteriaceae bacterium]|nr:hydrogenase [Microbacteriaceae bacterium]